MLVLQRKVNEALHIGPEIVVKVCKIRGNAVRLGIAAPNEVSVRRSELADDGRPSRPPALPDVHTEVGRLRAELEKVNRLDAALVSDLSEKLRVSEAISAGRGVRVAQLAAELAGLRASIGGAA